MNYKNLIGAISLSLISSVSFSAGYTGPAKIDWMTSMQGSGTGKHFVISGIWNNRDGCTNMSENIWRVEDPDGNLENLQSMYSMAMAAYMSGKTIELYQNGCHNNRPKGVSMYLDRR